jgi:hypothetical protein
MIVLFVCHLQWLHGAETEADKVVAKVEHHEAGDEPVVVVDPAKLLIEKMVAN